RAFARPKKGRKRGKSASLWVFGRRKPAIVTTFPRAPAGCCDLLANYQTHIGIKGQRSVSREAVFLAVDTFFHILPKNKGSAQCVNWGLGRDFSTVLSTHTLVINRSHFLLPNSILSRNHRYFLSGIACAENVYKSKLCTLDNFIKSFPQVLHNVKK
ncbi:MAG: hypothetical protein IJS37_04730, partial [Bacilli bacterium]|nr:hypothetical protein [Bacilli bacterium]